MEDTRKIAVENTLSSIHYSLGLSFITAGKLTTFSLWLVRNVPCEGDGDLESLAEPQYRYGHFFKLDSSGEGYDEKMFCPKSKSKSAGFRNFKGHNLVIEEVVKGRKAWQRFIETAKQETIIKCNDFTKKRLE